jgi:hypothetical protein
MTDKMELRLKLPEGTECICSVCWKVHRKLIPSRYANDPDLWREKGYLCIMCDPCKDAFTKWRNSPACILGLQGNYYNGGN